MTLEANARQANSPAGEPSSPEQGLKSLPMAEVMIRLESSPQGLSQDDATARLARYGPNEIAEHQSIRAIRS